MITTNTILYQVYWKGKKINSFRKPSDWPLIWGDKGCRIIRIANRRRRVFEVISKQTVYECFGKISNNPHIRIYVKEVKMPKLDSEQLFDLCRQGKARYDVNRISHKEIIYQNWRYFVGYSSPNRGYSGGWIVYKEKIN